jgi:hypothetical protein
MQPTKNKMEKNAIKLIYTASAVAVLAACGGGGDGNNESTSTSTTPTQATTNVKAALSELLTTGKRWESTSSTSNGWTAVILANTGSDALYGKQDSLIGPNKVTTIQLQIRDRSRVLAAKYSYQIYIDRATDGVVGAVGIYNDRTSLIPCINTAAQQTVPTVASVGESGAIIDGFIDFYEAKFRSGTYAHYCQFSLPPAPLPSKISWSVEEFANKKYICISDNILSATITLNKYCIGVDDKGKLDSSMKVFLYNNTGAVLEEFSS